MTKHIGVTVSRKGLTEIQRFRAKMLLAGYDVLHHGDCVGGDNDLDAIATDLKLRIVVHPPINSSLRAYCISSERREPKEYLARDRDIVDESERMIAFPNSTTPTPHSGTWYTVGYARKMGKPLAIVFPNGDVSFERWEE